MTQPPAEYKPSFFDQHGLGAAGLVTARVWGVAMGFVTLAILSSARGLTLMTVLEGVGAVREAHAVRPMSAGDDVYIANRLVDLYVGPLNMPYKAFRELRRIIERYDNTRAAQHARVALAALKERHAERLE